MAKLRPRNRLNVEIPVAAMSDIAFLLIIFFVISSSFQKASKLGVELPGEKASDSSERPPAAPKVHLTLERVMLNNAAVEVWELTGDLNDLLAGRNAAEERVVVLTAEDGVVMERVVEAMDAIRNANATVGYLGLEER
jgi:biopolymer transport protein ExbD